MQKAWKNMQELQKKKENMQEPQCRELKKDRMSVKPCNNPVKPATDTKANEFYFRGCPHSCPHRLHPINPIAERRRGDGRDLPQGRTWVWETPGCSSNISEI